LYIVIFVSFVFSLSKGFPPEEEEKASCRTVLCNATPEVKTACAKLPPLANRFEQGGKTAPTPMHAQQIISPAK
jgi:hypothetical protein